MSKVYYPTVGVYVSIKGDIDELEKKLVKFSQISFNRPVNFSGNSYLDLLPSKFDAINKEFKKNIEEIVAIDDVFSKFENTTKSNFDKLVSTKLSKRNHII